MAAGDLCLLSDVKGVLDNVSGSGHDALLGRIISSASQYFASITSRSLLAYSSVSQYTERRDGLGATRMHTKDTPIVSVVSVSINGIAIAAAANRVASGYDFDSESIFLRGFSFNGGAGAVDLVYTAGFASVPFDVSDCVIKMVASWYKRKSHLDQVSQSLQGQIVATFSSKDVPPECQVVISKYQRSQVFG